MFDGLRLVAHNVYKYFIFLMEAWSKLTPAFFRLCTQVLLGLLMGSSVHKENPSCIAV